MIPLIEDRLKKYSALRVLAENGENYDCVTRSLVVMDAIIGGKKDDYERIAYVQPEDNRLTFGTFSRLSDYFYVFRVRKDLREVLEIFTVLDGYSRSKHAEDFLHNLPENQRHPETREEMLLSLIKYEMVPEVASLGFSQLNTLRRALKFRELVKKSAPNQQLSGDFTDEEQRIVLASIVCDIAGLVSSSEDSGSLTLSENMASDLLFLIEHRAEPNMTQALCQLSE